MRVKPILFNTEMVRAILDGRKTQTRRVVKEFVGEEILSVRAPDGTEIGKYCRDGWRGILPDRHDGNTYCVEAKPPCKVGDILWVRETWCSCATIDSFFDGKKLYAYKADFEEGIKPPCTWRPSIHMPREAARIFLRVTDVRVERLQDIDDDGVVAEGLEIGAQFDELWNRTVKKSDRAKFGWENNPWVWVIEFERCEKP